MTDLLTANNYNWPGIYRPMMHQKVTADFMIKRPRAFCLNGIGTAKTLSLLWATDFLIHYKKVNKVLIAAPLSTLWTVWGQEIFMNLIHRKYAVLHGTKAKRLKELARNVDYYIINHDGIDVIADDLKFRKDISLVIVDEGAEIRNVRTRKWDSMWNFAGPHSGKGLWWVTGSPMPKGPTDIWAQARIINPGLVHTYFTRFRDDLMFKKGLFKWIPRPGWEQKCYGMLQPSIRFKRDECIDLPPCTTQTRRIEMSNEQHQAYTQMHNTFVAQLQDGTVTAANEGVKRIKLIQIAAGAVYDGYQVTHWLDCKPKLEVLNEVVKETENKAIIFVPFRHTIHLLQSYIEKKLKLTVGVIYGDIAPGKRTKIFNDFQHSNLQIILAHPGTMAHGLTLTASHTVIWWAPPDSYRIYEQANGRISRPGQTVKQTIVHLSCSEVEDKTYARLKNNEQLQGILLELLRKGRQ